jgi:hypothetical protein
MTSYNNEIVGSKIKNRKKLRKRRTKSHGRRKKKNKN